MSTFFKPRYILPLIFAVCIDGLSFLAGLIIWAVFFHPATLGAVAGCAAGLSVSGSQTACVIGGAVGGALGAAAAFIPFVGAVLAGAVNSIGWVLGYVVGFCINATFGVMLMMLLLHNGLLSAHNILSARRLAFIVAEFSPFAFLPLWTPMVWFCILDDAKKEALSSKKMPIRAAARTAWTHVREEQEQKTLLLQQQVEQEAAKTQAAKQALPKTQRTPRMNDIRTRSDQQNYAHI